MMTDTPDRNLGPVADYFETALAAIDRLQQRIADLKKEIEQ